MLWLLAMSLSARPGPGWLLFSFGMGLVSGSKCPKNCLCRGQEVSCIGKQLTEYPLDIPLDTRRLSLKDNRITTLPAMQLGLLSDLVYLDCQNNRIREVMDYTFIGVFKLLYLDLSSNNLTSISPSSFSVLSSLVQLSIANNPHLLYLDKHTFANTSSLRILDLRNTGLQTLEYTGFSHLTVLQTLYLSGNPWKCNCSFLEFVIHLRVSRLNQPDVYWDARTLGYEDKFNATCAEPSGLTGWPLAEVSHPLQYMCITHLTHQDYMFLLLIGFCIFAAGTVAAWLTGVCAVLYQNTRRKSMGDENEEEPMAKVEISRQLFLSRSSSNQGRFPEVI